MRGIRIIRNFNEDVTDKVIVQTADGWHINWGEVPKLQFWFYMNLLHEAFMRKRPYPTQEEAINAIVESMGLRTVPSKHLHTVTC